MPPGHVGNVSVVTTGSGRGRIAPALAITVGVLALAGCNAPTFGEFRGSTTQGQDEFKLWVFMFVAGLVVAAFVWGLIFWTVLRHRRRGDEIPRQVREHIPLEIAYTIVPLIVVLAIFYFTVVTENRVDAISSHPDQVVTVTAYQWGWQFSYQGGHKVTIATSEEPGPAGSAALPSSSQYPQLMLPLGETVEIDLESDDVAHSLWVPAFNFSRMALPGHLNQFDFTPTQLGVFDGRCNQYCGLYHSEMLFSVKVMKPAAFKSWLASTSAAQAAGGGTATQVTTAPGGSS